LIQKVKHKIIDILKKISVPGFAGMSAYDLVIHYWEGIFKGFITLRAGAIAYSFFMALFPFLLFTLSIIPLVPIPGFQEDFIAFFHDVLPPKTREIMDGIIYDIATRPKKGLMSFSIILSFLFMANGVNTVLTSFEESINKIIDKRNFFKQYLVALGLSISLVIILFFTIIALIYFEIIIVYQLKEKGIIDDYNFWMEWGKKLFYVAMLLISISIIYYYGTKEGKQLRFISPGSIMTTLLVIINFQGFQFYIDHFNRYNQLYGSIGAFLILLLMIYFNSIILLLGHELNMAILAFKQNRDKKLSESINH
jgi:membrane protein